MLKVVHSFVDSKRMICFCMACAMLSVALISFGAHATNPQSVDYNVYVKPSLNISVSSNSVVLNINPAGSLNGSNNPNNFASNSLNVSVATNNQYGYRLYMNSNTSDLVKTDDNTEIIPTLSTATTESNFPYNKWGYKFSTDTDYQPFQANTNIPISSSDTATNEISTTLNFGAKANYDKKAGTYELDLNFKALPEVTTNYIQNLDPDLCTEDPTVVIDSRDEQPYTVQRLKDGNCWMMTNLNLNHVSADLTAADTNIVAGTTLSKDTFNGWMNSNWTREYSIPEMASSSGIDSVTNTSNGMFYNYCAATAGTYCYGSSEGVGNSDQDLCPAGWRLPTGLAGGEFDSLYAEYNSFAKMHDPILSNSAAFNLAGYYDDIGIGRLGTNSYYWSSTKSNERDMGVLIMNGPGSTVATPNTVMPANPGYRHYGFSIRCIRTKSMQDFSSDDAASMSIGDRTTLRDTRDGQYYTVSKLADGNVWMVDNLLFQGNSVDPSDSDVTTPRTLYNGGSWSNGYSLDGASASSTSSNCYGDTTGNGAGYNNFCMYYVSSDVNSGGKPNAWYNYPTATAGNIVGAQNSSLATESICPKGWSLPSHAQTTNLASLIGSSPSSFNPTYNGYYSNGTLSVAGTFGGWWDTGVYSDYSRFNLQYLSGAMSPTNYSRRSGGHAIRCIAK